MKNTYLTVLFIVLVDQILKIWIKLTYPLGGGFEITDWFHIHFVENPGMAFGMELFHKLWLTCFRLLLIVGIFFLIRHMRKHAASKVVIFAFSLVLAGALGNVIDSIFYGELFTHSFGQVATLDPSHGYETWFYGRVVDMFYFPFWEGNLPEWIPWIGGNYFEFFRHVFNFADFAISTAVGLLLLYNKQLNDSFQTVPSLTDSLRKLIKK